MTLSLKYNDLSNTITESNNLASELGQYCDELSRKVQQKMYAVEGGMSSALSSADYYVNQKIKQLHAREDNARTLANKTQTLLNTAKRVDADVEKTIQANQNSFFTKNPELKAPEYKQAFVSFMCDAKKVPVLGWLIKQKEQEVGTLVTLMKEIRYRWRAGGGKELITNVFDIVVKFGLAVAAVATFVGLILTGAGIVFIIAAAIAALIAGINARANLFTSVQAIMASGSGHPAMSKIYANRDKLSDILREENFGKKWNRLLNGVATALDTTETVCDIVLIVRDIGKAFKELGLGKLFKNSSLSKPLLPTKASILKALSAFRLEAAETAETAAKIEKGKKWLEFMESVGEYSSTLDGLNQVLKGEDKWWEFGLSLGIGEIFTKLEEKSSSFENTKAILDKVGVIKLITDLDPSGTLTKIIGSDEGLLQLVIPEFSLDIPEFSLDLTVIRDKLNALQNTGVLGVSRRVYPTLISPAIILPKLDLSPKFESRYPYFAMVA